MSNRSKDWMRQAESDLEHAQKSIMIESFEWACFAAHQAAEKAVKSVYQKRHEIVLGHSILRLIQGISCLQKDSELLNIARKLDRFYIQTRYPNGFDEGAPVDYYTQEDAEYAVEASQKVLRFCKESVAGEEE